jgi:hypothetical protein
MASDDRTRSKGGSTIYRHGERERARAPEPAVDVGAHARAAIEEHVARHVGPISTVLHERVSDRVHLDVHLVAPGDTHPFWFLFTTGMSARPMTLPPGVRVTPFAELSILLPPDWKLDAAAWADERWYWPIYWLRTLARLPHDHATWLGEGHTVPYGDPPRPFAPDTELCGMLVLRSLSLPPEVHEIPLGDHTVDLFTLWPLLADEMQHKLDHGTDSLLVAFDAADLDDVIDPGRPSVFARR